MVFADPAATAAMRGRWSHTFGERIGSAFDGRIVLEIGCADGTFLNAIAAQYPHTGFIGLDWKTKAIYDAALRTEANNLKNLLLIRGRAQALRDTFADAELEEIWVFHPDPCDRDAERQNRLVSDAFLASAHAVLHAPGATLCLKTDHAEYHDSVLRLFHDRKGGANRHFEIIAQSRDFWSDAEALRHTESRRFRGFVTAYEDKFRRKRKPIHYLEMAKR